MIRGCSDSFPNTVDGCTKFDPLFSYHIPPYQLSNATNFTDEFSKALNGGLRILVRMFARFYSGT